MCAQFLSLFASAQPQEKSRIPCLPRRAAAGSDTEGLSGQETDIQSTWQRAGCPLLDALCKVPSASGLSSPCLPCSGSLTASTRLLALPWNCLPQAPAWLGTVRDTGRALRVAPLSPSQGAGSPDQELQWTDGKLLLSFSVDSVPSSRRVGMGCGGQPRLLGVAGGVAQGRGNVVGEWLLWRRGLRPATANACGHTRSTGYRDGQAGGRPLSNDCFQLVPAAWSSYAIISPICILPQQDPVYTATILKRAS